jgi:poly(3-hydroxybutyrate) depolymerase
VRVQRRDRFRRAALRAAGLLSVLGVVLALVALAVRLPAGHDDQGGSAPSARPVARPTTVLAAGTSSGAVPAASSATAATWRDVAVGTLQRRYLLAVPPGPGPHPLLVVLHGLNQHTATFLRSTGIVPAALAAGVAVAGPETPDLAWNDGRFGRSGRDDDAYVLAVVDQLVAAGRVDPTRVSLAGFSNGAGMSVELASRHPDRFASLVLVGGELLQGSNEPRPTAPMRTLLVHGTQDPVQPWLGRARRSPRLPAQVGVPATVAAFVAAAQDAMADPVEPDAQRPLAHTPGRIPVTAERWRGLADVTLYRLVGAGHVWPVTACAPGTCRPDGDVARLADVSATTLAVDAALLPAA